MNDMNTSIIDLKVIVAEFIHDLKWGEFHNSKNLATCIGIEAAELQEHFQWLTIEEGKEYIQKNKVVVSRELADIFIYCLSFANQAGIDVSKSVQEKIEDNKIRFPISEYFGKHT